MEELDKDKIDDQAPEEKDPYSRNKRTFYLPPDVSDLLSILAKRDNRTRSKWLIKHIRDEWKKAGGHLIQQAIEAQKGELDDE